MPRFPSATLPEDLVARLTIPTDELLRLAGGLGGWQLGDPDRRTAMRFGATRPVLVHPLDEQFEPKGSPFVALARNLSSEGLALLVPQVCDATYLRLRVSNPTEEDVIEVLLEVGRWSRVGDLVEIAGRFVRPPNGEAAYEDAVCEAAS